MPSCATTVAAMVMLASIHAVCLAAPSYSDVSRIFSERCLGCHAASVKMGSLNLETYDGFQQGGTHTSLVVPGKSAESRLYLLITGKAMPSMPMDGGKLSAQQIETVRDWIDAGAAGPTTSKTQIFDLAYSADGKLLALAGYREVRLGDASTKQQAAVLDGHASGVRAVAFSRDARLLAAAVGAVQQSCGGV